MATLQQITANDIASWDSLSDVASTLEKRGLKIRENLGEANELVLQLTDREFIVLVEAGPGESASDFKPDDRRRRTNLVATNDYKEFTFLTRIRALDGQQHGRIKHQKLSFTKEQMTSETGEKNTILQKLNSLEFGSAAAIYDDLYDTKQVVKEFYQQFETLRTHLVQEVAGIPDDRGDAKQRYVQVTLDRMIFLYFIQEKRLLDRDPNYLHDHHKQRVDEGENVYEQFYEPLFFDYLAENKKSTEFGALPYLNGGLFSKNPIEEEFEEARLGDTTEHTNELFGDILDFLSDWNWNVDERLDIVDPKNLSPAILGHIFEQTVNQKEMGAYYTPEEITGFMSRRTIHPYLLDQLNEEVGANYEEIDDVFGFPAPDAEGGVKALADGGAVTAQVPTENVDTRHVESLYHDFLKEARVLDPAVGSGAFLLAAQEVLLDIYMQCIEFFQQMDEEGKTWELEERTVEELETIEKGRGSASLYAKRSIILNNLYGVDIDDGAVEICKLRLWLSMVADIEDEPSEVEPLPNIDFNIRQGNSLIGFTELTEVTDAGDAPLTNWGGGVGEGVRTLYEEVIDEIERHRSATSAKEATGARVSAEEKIKQHSTSLNNKLLAQFQEAGKDEVTIKDIESLSPFHWVLEFAPVYRDGGFDIVIGNPPWDVVSPNKDEFFTKYDPLFSKRLPDDKRSTEKELREREGVEQQWGRYERSFEIRNTYFNDTPAYNLQSPKIDGRTVANNQNDLSALFFERTFSLTGKNGQVALILPGAIYSGSNSKDVRLHLLNNCTLNSLIGFENRGIFEDIHSQYNFAITIFKNSGETDTLKGVFQKTDLDILQDLENHAAEIPKRVLAQYSPKARIFPFVRSQREADVIDSIVQHPSLGEKIDDKWYATPRAELHRGKDRDRFTENREGADYPVLGGSNIYQFEYNRELTPGLDEPELWSVEEDKPEKSAKYRLRKKRYPFLKKAIYEAFDGTGSQKGFVNDLLEEERGSPLAENDVLLDCSDYRLVYRKITNSTNERTTIVSVLPPGVVTHDSIYALQNRAPEPTEEELKETPLHSVYKRIFSNEELFAALGLMNSLPFDFLMRTKIDTNLVIYKFKESQMPRLTEGDQYFDYISNRAARLNCYGDEFAEMRERLGGIESATDRDVRQELQAEIDAAAFHTYGLGKEDVQFVLDDFHRVQNPRMMTEEYFDLVYEKFERLEKEGPHK